MVTALLTNNSMYKLLLLSCWLTAVQGGGGPIRSYSFSYATPDGQSRYEHSDRGSLTGGYKYKTPEGAVVAVRYTNDVGSASGGSYVQHMPGRYFRRSFDKSSSGVRAHAAPIAYRVLPKQSYAFSYATPDGQSRYESNEDGAVKGGYEYTTPDGTVVKVRYVADENGFRTLDDGFVDHGPKVGTARSAYSYSYSHSGLPLTRPTPTFQVKPSLTVSQVQRPLTYYYAPPAAAYHVRDVDDDDDDDDDDHDDDDRKLVYLHGLPIGYQAIRPYPFPVKYPLPVTYQQQLPVTYQQPFPVKYPLPVTYQQQLPVTYQQPFPVKYPLPVTYPKQYNTARVAQVPLVNYGYVISQ